MDGIPNRLLLLGGCAGSKFSLPPLRANVRGAFSAINTMPHPKKEGKRILKEGHRIKGMVEGYKTKGINNKGRGYKKYPSQFSNERDCRYADIVRRERRALPPTPMFAAV